MVHPVALMVKFKQFTGPESMLMVPGAPLPLSTNTESVEVGTLAPLAPPEESDQFAVSKLFQLFDPPTQYLSAMPDLD
jgi:hypothetical protein